MKSYTLRELNGYIQRVIALNFQEPLWVKAEILQLKTTRGHTYVELVEKDPDGTQIAAQASAVLWSGTRRVMAKEIPGEVDDYLQPGTEVSLLVQISYHPVYGLKLSINNLDPSYTLGKLEILRQETIARIKKEGLYGLNQGKILPAVLQRIAVISSPQASGYHDFVQQLEQNEYGYDFELHLYPNAMQGTNMKPELLENLARVNAAPTPFDCLVIIRGGGSKLDLSFFDQFEISRDIALSTIPVLTGIGHETDHTVADLVSYKSLKTPTAVAAFILEQNLIFETQLLTFRDRIGKAALQHLQLQDKLIHRVKDHLVNIARTFIQNTQHQLQTTSVQIDHAIRTLIQNESSALKAINQKLVILRPESVFKRGYSITTKDGQLVKDVGELTEGDEIETRLLKGKIRSLVTKTT